MKMFVLHDEKGNIRAVVTAPADGPVPLYQGAQPGESLVEVDAPEISFDPTSEEGHEKMLRLIDDYRVDFTRHAKLTPKRRPKK
jgi:hypothetical protein